MTDSWTTEQICSIPKFSLEQKIKVIEAAGYKVRSHMFSTYSWDRYEDEEVSHYKNEAYLVFKNEDLVAPGCLVHRNGVKEEYFYNEAPSKEEAINEIFHKLYTEYLTSRMVEYFQRKNPVIQDTGLILE